MKPFQALLMLFVLLAAVLISGCHSGVESQSGVSMIKRVDPKPTAVDGDNSRKDYQLAEQIKQDVASREEIYDVAVIKGKKEVLVAYKVKHMQRFRMKKIEKDLSDSLKKKYPEEHFIVSSDFKIFIEALDLKEKISEKKLSDKQAEKELGKIISLKKELT